MSFVMLKIKTLFVVIALALSMGAFAQYGNKGSNKDTLVTNNTYATRTGTWKIIINKKSGSCYYWCKTKDGKIARRYCPKEVSAEIAKKYNVKYTPKK